MPAAAVVLRRGKVDFSLFSGGGVLVHQAVVS